MRRLSLAIIGAGLLAMSSSSAFAQCAVVRLNGSNSASASGVVGGAQLGYSWQRGSFVYGLETDISAMDLTSEINTTSTTNACGGPVSVTANTNADVNWYGTVRGRLGWSSGPILFYGTGGLAYGRVGLNSTLNASEPGFSAFLNAHTSSVKTGWVAGGGIEYALRPNVFLNLGYQYVDLGTVTVTDPFIAPITLTQTASAHAQFSVVTFGISWRFSPIDTSPQGPWEGAYFGGHIGGTWGNRTNAAYSGSTIPFATNCFTGITQVVMADGTSRSISEVAIGDEVLGENGNVNKVVEIEIHFLGGRKLYAFNDGPAFVTPEHPFMTRAGWKSMAPEATLAETGNFSVGALKVGDEVVRLEAVKKRAKPIVVAGDLVPTPSVEVVVETEFSELKSITPHDSDPSTTVYNLKLDGNHTYFANNYLTHNK